MRPILKTLGVSVILMALVTVSCKKETVLDVSPSSVIFGDASVTKTLDISSNTTWSISAPEWIVLQPASGDGNATVSVSVTDDSGFKRTGTIVVTGGDKVCSVNVTLSGAEFIISPDSFVFDEQGTPMTAVVRSAFDWEVEIPAEASWLTVEPMTGAAGETTITLSPAPLTDREPRSDQLITIRYGETFSMFPVSQTMPNEAPEAPVPLSPADGATDVNIMASFSWSASVDPDGDEIKYKLMVSDDNGKKWKTATTTSTSAVLQTFMSVNTDYIWKVVASDPFGGQTESEVASFTTGTEGAHADGEVRLVQEATAGAPNPVNLVVLGDGFIAEDYISGGAFDQAANTAIESFFSLEPYSSRKNYFRIHTVAAYSEERGADVKSAMSGCPAQTKNTVFDSVLEGGNSTGTSCNYDKVFAYVTKVDGIDDAELDNMTVLLMINLDVYAGTCLSYLSGRSIAMCPMGRDSFRTVVMHECGGHGFGRLLDEYRYYNDALPAADKNHLLDWRAYDPLYGYNIDVTGNLSEVHWKHYIGRSGYEGVGLYEGAFLYYKNVWRPEDISCMEDNRPYYNAPSREAIVRRIMAVAGLDFNLDEFMAEDVVNASGDASRARLMAPPAKDFIPLAPPVLIDNR